MSIDDSELREYTHGLFGSMAAVLKQDFQPFLATCVAAALASCEQVSPWPLCMIPISPWPLCMISVSALLCLTCKIIHSQAFSTRGKGKICIFLFPVIVQISKPGAVCRLWNMR